MENKQCFFLIVLFVYLLVCLFVCLFVHLFAFLFVYCLLLHGCLAVSPFILDIALLFNKDHNDTLFVKCVFGGSPQPSVSWLFNGEQIPRETDVTQNSDTSGDTYRYESVLTVRSQELREKMEVEFTCVVRNMFGQLRTTVPHNIQGKMKQNLVISMLSLYRYL